MLAEGQVAAARRQEYLLNKRLLHLYGRMNLGEEEREGRGEEEKGTPTHTSQRRPPHGGAWGRDADVHISQGGLYTQRKL